MNPTQSSSSEFRTVMGWHLTHAGAIDGARRTAAVWNGEGPATIHRYEVERRWPFWRVVKVWRPKSTFLDV